MTNSIFKISVPSSSTSLRSSTCSTPLPRRIRRIQRPAYLSTPPTRNMPGTPKVIPSQKRKRLEEVCKSERNNNFNQKQHLDQHNLLIHGISDDQNCEGCDTCKERQVLETMKALIENKLNSLAPCTL